MQAMRPVLLLIALCALAAIPVGLAWADDPPPPAVPLAEPAFEPVVQWGVSAPSVSQPAVLLPQQLPPFWSYPPPAVQPPEMPALVSPGTQLQPVAQWTSFDRPVVQSIIPRSIDFPDARAAWGSVQSPSSFSTAELVRAATTIASADARWQSEEQLMRRDLKEMVKAQLDVASLAVPVLGGAAGVERAWAWLQFGVSRLSLEPAGTAMTVADTADAYSTRDWGRVFSNVVRWGLDHTFLQPPSAQSLTGPFVSTSEFTRVWQDSYFKVVTQGSVQVALQPVFSQNPTQWFALPDSYVETTTTHWRTTETYGSGAVWTGSYVPQYTMPSFPRYTTPSFPQYTMPSFPRYTVPSVPQYTTPPIQQPNW